MREVIYALLPACGVGIYFFGLPALVVLLLCTGGCVATEALCRKAAGAAADDLADGSAALTGILLALNLPPSAPWWLALLGCVVAIAIGKQVYGGLGLQPLQPGAGRPGGAADLLPGADDQLDALRRRWAPASTPSPPPPRSGRGQEGGDAAPASCRQTLQGTRRLPARPHGRLPRRGLGAPCCSAPPTCSGSKILTWHIPARLPRHGGGACRGSSGWSTRPLPQPALPSADRRPDPRRLLHGHRHGHLAGHPRGMLIFGVGCGVMTVLIRLFGGYPEGVSFAILLMNARHPPDRSLHPAEEVRPGPRPARGSAHERDRRVWFWP